MEVATFNRATTFIGSVYTVLSFFFFFSLSSFPPLLSRFIPLTGRLIFRLAPKITSMVEYTCPLLDNSVLYTLLLSLWSLLSPLFVYTLISEATTHRTIRFFHSNYSTVFFSKIRNAIKMIVDIFKGNNGSNVYS